MRSLTSLFLIEFRVACLKSRSNFDLYEDTCSEEDLEVCTGIVRSQQTYPLNLDFRKLVFSYLYIKILYLLADVDTPKIPNAILLYTLVYTKQ